MTKNRIQSDILEWHVPEEILAVLQIADRIHPVIRLRVDKNAEEQRQRSVKRAEVFMPSWICNKQNNLVEFAEIISWNIWQMDGIKDVVPMSCKPKVTKIPNLNGTFETRVEECPGCRNKGNRQHFGMYCKIMNWETGQPIEFRLIVENGGGHG